MMLQLDAEHEEVLALLDDEYARTILVETYREPRSVNAPSTACEADPSTVYRRVDREWP